MNFTATFPELLIIFVDSFGKVSSLLRIKEEGHFLEFRSFVTTSSKEGKYFSIFIHYSTY